MNARHGKPARRPRPSPRQLAFLQRGLDQPGGKLPLFDEDGQRIDARTVKACVAHGWAEPWARNPIKPDWLICRLTAEGRRLAERARRRSRRKEKPRAREGEQRLGR